MKTTRVLVIVGTLAALAVLPAAAELYTVELTNGYALDTRYRPKLDPRDPDKVFFLTDQGTWISIPRNQVHDVTSQTEMRGFGKVINTTTIDLGWAPNDTPVPDGAGGVNENPQAELINMLRDRAKANTVNTPQFVNPSQAGKGGGLPVFNSFP